MIEVREEVRRSWFDPTGSRALAARCAERLKRRCEGERGLFLTLSYRREEWSSARECYHAASAERHVRRFIERLGAWLFFRQSPEEKRWRDGKPVNPLNGRWVCKMEFQADGFVHWHLIILGWDFIAHDMVEKCWGHGFVWVSRMTNRRVRYLTKYVAKSGGVPAWLYLEPSRSVKIIRASPGFWRDTEYVKRHPAHWQRVSAFESVGDACARAKGRTQVITSRQHRRTTPRPLAVVIARARSLGMIVGSVRRGWLSLRWPMKPVGRPPRRSRGGEPEGLHLTDTPNPPMKVPPWWFIEAMRSLSEDPRDWRTCG